MTAEIHTCSYECERPECVRRQRDELRDRLEAVLAKQPPSAPVGANVRKAGEVSPYSDVVLVADLSQQPAGVVPECGYAGCTLWRGGLRITVVEPKSLERRIDPDQAFCDMVQRALDSLAAAWNSGTSAAQQQGGAE